MGFPEIYQLFAPGKCQILPSFPLSLRALQKWGHIFWHRKKGEIEKYFLLFTPPASVKPDVGHVSFFPKQESDKIYRRPQRQKSETFEKQKVFFLERLGKTEEIGNRVGVLFPPPPSLLYFSSFRDVQIRTRLDSKLPIWEWGKKVSYTIPSLSSSQLNVNQNWNFLLRILSVTSRRSLNALIVLCLPVDCCRRWTWTRTASCPWTSSSPPATTTSA